MWRPPGHRDIVHRDSHHQHHNDETQTPGGLKRKFGQIPLSIVTAELSHGEEFAKTAKPIYFSIFERMPGVSAAFFVW